MEGKFTAAVITISTRAYKGEYEDVSGAVLVELLKSAGFNVLDKIVVSDDKKAIKKAIRSFAKSRKLRADLIITTGGTGVASSDVTPESCLELSKRVVPGISEAIRAKSLEFTPNALISRGVSVIIKNTLVINFPGSPKACKQSFGVVLPILEHALGLINGKRMDK